MAAILELYLIRHAIAAERGPKYPDDRKRPLTPEGIKRFKESVRGLVALGVELDVILPVPSPARRRPRPCCPRASRSACRSRSIAVLAPGGKFNAIVEAVTKQAKRHRRIALVGHEPDLGEMTARWLGARGHVAFRKGAICAIDVDSATPVGPGHAPLVAAASGAASARPVMALFVIATHRWLDARARRHQPDSPVRAGTAPSTPESALARDVLGRHGLAVEVAVTGSRGDAREFSQRAREGGAGLVVAWGGDGTINEVGSASSAPTSRSASSRADPGMAWHGSSAFRSTPAPRWKSSAAAAPAASTAAASTMPRRFFNVAGVGLDALISHHIAQPGRSARPRRATSRLTFGELPWYQPASSIGSTATATPKSVVRSSSRLPTRGNMATGRRSRPAARLDDGLLDLVVVDAQPLWRIAVADPAICSRVGSSRAADCTCTR